MPLVPETSTEKTFLDRTDWPSKDLGWGSEPDFASWTDDATKLPCIARRGTSGAWCGYVAVPPGHPLHGLSYADAPDLDVHGGLTYSERCTKAEEMMEGHPPVCHTPPPGEPDDMWWFGFDCAHFNDYMPALIGRQHKIAAVTPDPKVKELFGRDTWDGTYRTFDYVVAECRNLASQLADLGGT